VPFACFYLIRLKAQAHACLLSPSHSHTTTSSQEKTLETLAETSRLYRKSTREFVEPSPETLKRLLELQPYAQQVRSYGKAYRKEAEEYTWLVNYAHTVEGVTLYRLAKRLGVTHGALRFRLARYGYKSPVSGASKAYTPILEENRINLRPVE
jgi:hypothetical protein